MQLIRLFSHASARARVNRTARAVACASAVLAFGFAAACNDDGVTNKGSVTVALSSNAILALPGAPGTASVNITRAGTFTGDVVLVAEGLPAGVTASFAPPTLGAGVTSSTMSLTVGAAAASGTSTVTVRATGTGANPGTATTQLTVNISSITLTAGSANVTSPQGGSATVALTLARLSGFTGAVNLAAEGLPANVTAAFSPTSFAAGVTNSTLTLSPAANAATGVYNITVRASGAGVADKTVPVQLTVTTGATPDYTLTAAPAAVSVSPGGVVTSTININRTGGFIDNLGFTNSAVPNGVVATFSPNPANANSTTLTFATTTSAVPGVYTITATGIPSSSGPSRTVNIVLTVNPPPGLSIALNPNNAPVVVGQSAQTSVVITRVGGLAGDLTMSVDNLPAGVTASFVPAVVTGTATQATFAVAASVPPGVYLFNVKTSNAGGAITASAPFTLVVSAAPSISVSLASASTSITAGGTGTLTANIIRNGGFTGPVTFGVTGLPAGITTTVTPAPATGPNATINITVGASVTPGQYTGSLNGSGTGVPSTATPFTITVNPAGGGGSGTNIVWQFCDAARVPLFFAVRDGTTGAWTKVNINVSNRFIFDITQGKGGALYVQNIGGNLTTSVFYETTAELQATAEAECTVAPQPGAKTFTGTVTGFAAGESANIYMGGGSTSANFAVPNFTLNTVKNGVADLVATRTQAAAPTVIDKILVRRGLNLPSGTVLAPLDFSSGEASAPVAATITIGNLNFESAALSALFVSANGTTVPLNVPAFSTATTRAVVGVSGLAGADLHSVLVTAVDNTIGSARSVSSFFGAMSDRSVDLGPTLNFPTISSSTSTVSRPRAQGVFQAEYTSAVAATFSQGSKSITLTGTQGYFNGIGYDMEMPDLTPIASFDPAWGLATNTLTNWTVNASNGGVGGIGNGSNIRTAARIGQYTSSAIRASSIKR